MDKFSALVINKNEQGINTNIEQITTEQLSEGDVLIKVNYSSLNYKDMLATQPHGGVIRNYPMIPGIDLSGEIVETGDPNFEVGQSVLVTGYQMGMSHTGGFAEYARVPAEWVIPLPNELSTKAAMKYGTAGLTAGLSINKLENHGIQVTDTILVTGATGGVGSIAIQMLIKAGYQNVIALVRKPNQVEVTKKLGATQVILASEFEFSERPLAKQTFDYILDTVGGDLLAKLIPFVSYQGSVSTCGNAGGIKLNTTVLPFILRGINLLGVDSVNITHEERVGIWNKLANQWNVSDQILVNEINFADILTELDKIKSGHHLGRSIVKIN